MRPADIDLARQLVRNVRKDFDLPVAFAGLGDSAGVVMGAYSGTQTDAVKNLNIVAGRGLGGLALRDNRPGAVADYLTAATITDDYQFAVVREGLRTVAAVPIMGDRTRMVLYVAHRAQLQFGDRVKDGLVTLARQAGQELRIRDEVDRRMQLAETAAANSAQEFVTTSVREELRELHAELRTIAASVEDADLRQRLLNAGLGLARVGRSAPVPEGEALPTLTTRELDVLSQVALGCSNAEAADRLALKTETVKAYLRSAARKLGTSGRTASVARARALGLLP
ncbi:LuxR C-terminal-related transcriptional regulator [Corynebacterium ulceribovis]|uniref:LuxR C-terminal-related transcriptional regulator n=1 Tax=Corynebacterium ulceribovis TaxID=487732 RepID=UPI000365B1B4|nr:LuxR C-terminal-related transcriptional regulator [Corynebacterium ulceribovis]